MKIKKIFWVLFFILFFVPKEGWPIGITASGLWGEVVNEADLQSGPGSNLLSTYTSTSNKTTLNITSSTGAWTVSVRRTDTTWNAAFTLYVMRTGAGTGTGTITGGTSWLAVTTSDQVFFTGTLTRSTIPIQYQLTGMSLSITPANFRTQMRWTVGGV